MEDWAELLVAFPIPSMGTCKTPAIREAEGATTSGPGAPVGNGGGLVRIVAQTIQLDGSLIANGGEITSASPIAAGSGGGVRIDVGTLAGAGQITAKGGDTLNAGGGGGGRVAIYYEDASGFDLLNVTAPKGVPGGQDGTVFSLQQPFMASFFRVAGQASGIPAEIQTAKTVPQKQHNRSLQGVKGLVVETQPQAANSERMEGRSDTALLAGPVASRQQNRYLTVPSTSFSILLPDPSYL